ncbi:unnamed protein product, partial [Staurois parvus]
HDAIGNSSCQSPGLAPGDHRVLLTGERSVCKQYRSLPCQLQHAALYCSAGCLPSTIHTQHTVKHTQHTVNPLIAPYVNPFLPSVITTVSVLFISSDHCIGVTGDVSDTKSVPPQCQNVCHIPAVPL